MPVNWKDPNAFNRLLAAMVAAQDMKLDYRKIATMYGNGATYDSIEGRFRIIKKEAAELKAEIDSGQRSEAPARIAGTTTPKKPKSTPNTPSKKEKIIGGRVGKGNGTGTGTPSKKRAAAVKGIKEEPDSSSSSFIEAPGAEDDEVSAAVAGNSVQGPDIGGDELSLYYDGNFVDDGMDMEAF